MAQQAYRTSEVHSAYRVLLALRDDLRTMEARGRQQLKYPYCQKIVNGQLFALAECLGDTNAADSFLRQSTRYFIADRSGAGAPTNKLTRDYIRQTIESYDNHTGPPIWRSRTNTAN